MIHRRLLVRARLSPNEPAIVEREHTISYGALWQRARALAARLHAAGVEPGDRVAIYLDKSVEAVSALYATWLVGAAAVPIHDGQRSPQVRHIMRHCRAKAFVSRGRHVQRLDPNVTAGAALLDVDDEAAAARCAPLDSPAQLPDGAPAVILYTSGSTGLAKGIVVSHANLLAGARIVARYLGIRGEDRILSVLPFNFDYGLNQLLTAVHCGATLYLQRGVFVPDICDSLARWEISVLAGVPPLWIQLMQDGSPLPQLALPKLRLITNSGGVFPVEVLREYRRHFPHVAVYLMYGLSEAFRSTYLDPSQVDVRPDSMGKAIPETEIWVLNETGAPCAPGEIGELVHRGPTVALGYFGDEAATSERWRPNPFAPDSGERVVYSGDLVRTDAEGFLYFVGRRDTMIKSSGVRISPQEVEELVYASELVAEVVACGEPHPVAGMAVVVHVVPRDRGAFQAQALLAHCRRTMPVYMVPKAIHVHDEFPRTPSGKIDRKRVVA
jgi:acyl-CoA ligase (AMP-forming) (exosortase A-associated)